MPHGYSRKPNANWVSLVLELVIASCVLFGIAMIGYAIANQNEQYWVGGGSIVLSIILSIVRAKLFPDDSDDFHQPQGPWVN